MNVLIAALEEAEFSQTFTTIYKHAIGLGCWGIRYDVDGEILEGITFYA